MKKVAVFTSIRSEYGLLSPLLAELKEHPSFKLDLLVGGAHLLDSFGKTISFIEEDGFEINHKFPFLYSGQKEDDLYNSLSSLQYQIGRYFHKNKPDLLIVLGDRYELIPVALAATLYKVPIAHISGGETTEGAIDNQIRHALTKFSNVHFPATEQYAKNIKLMGEEGWRICVSGEPGIDLINKISFINKEELFAELGLNLELPVLLVTFHPETLSGRLNPGFIQNLLNEMIKKGFQVIATAANFDEGGVEINRLYEKMTIDNKCLVYHKSLGQRRYYSLLKHIFTMIGNSSSGLVEAQSFELPVVNVGNRQKGRLANPGVINVPISIDSINEALKELETLDFQKRYKGKPNIYGDGNACKRIISFLENLDWNNLLNKKDCFDV